jgi:hypothetical protein
MEEFPPNSKKATSPEEKHIERVTSSDAIRRKKPLGKKFVETFFGADLKSVTNYVITEVLVPAAKDMAVEAGSQGLERFIFGDTSPRRRSTRNSPQGHIAYNRMNQQARPSERPGIGRPRTGRIEFDEIIVPSRAEGQEVLSRMYDILSRYESVTVSDLYELVGLRASHTDLKWGWTELHGASVDRLRDGNFLLDLPTPEAL